MHDMRTFIKQLEEAGELLRITKPVDPVKNMGGLAWQGENYMGKATMFENIIGHPGWRAVSYICGSRKRLSMAVGCEPEDFIKVMNKKLSQGLTPCKKVGTGPVKEVIKTGNDINVMEIPSHIHNALDAGRYFGSGMAIVRDPDTGIQNVTLHRNQVKTPHKLGKMVHPNRHTDLIIQKYEAKQQPTPVAIVIGHHPAYYLGSCWTTAFGVDELELTGTFVGEPVEVVKCETIDVDVPAHAEIVIEGHIPPFKREEEGPFCEHHGYSRAGSGLNHYVEITAITHRKDAIHYALQGGTPRSESQILDGMPMEVIIYNRIKNVGGFAEIHDVVAIPDAGGSMIIVVKMTPRIEGEVNDILLAVLSSEYRHPKIAIAVDDDVNPHDLREIIWSLSTRVGPVKDVFIVPNTRGHQTDATADLLSLEGIHPRIRLGSKMGINACKPPLRKKEDRDYFTRTLPMGLKEFPIKEFTK